MKNKNDRIIKPSFSADFPGYIKLAILPKESTLVDQKSVIPPAFTNLSLKEIDEPLPYHDFYQQYHEEIPHPRIPHSLLLLRGDYVPPAEIIAKGGFLPHGITNGLSPPRVALDPAWHNRTSRQSGCVSCTSKMDVLKTFYDGFSEKLCLYGNCYRCIQR